MRSTRASHPRWPAALVVFLAAACVGGDPGDRPRPADGGGAMRELEVRVADGTIETVGVPQRPRRIVSQSEASDDILLALVDPERLIALSSRSRTGSPQPSKVEQIGTFVESNAEQILGLQPDFVVTAAYSAPELVSHLHRAGVAQLQLQRFDGWADIRDNILLLGGAVDAEESARLLVEDLERRLDSAQRAAEARTGARRRALAYTYGNAQATGSTFDDVLGHCAGDNVAAELDGWAAVDVEQIAAWDPDVVFLSGDASVDGEPGAGLLEHPVLQRTRIAEPGRVVVIPGTLFGTVSQRYVDLVERVCAALDTVEPRDLHG